jgi:hypothetical protein
VVLKCRDHLGAVRFTVGKFTLGIGLLGAAEDR